MKNPTLSGRWHHGNGVLCSGTLRVASANFDTNPTKEIQEAVFQDICDAMNSRLAGESSEMEYIVKNVLQSCVDTLDWHGMEHAAEQIKYLAASHYRLLIVNRKCKSNCDTCTFSWKNIEHLDKSGYCYMFREEPEGICEKHT